MSDGRTIRLKVKDILKSKLTKVGNKRVITTLIGREAEKVRVLGTVIDKKVKDKVTSLYVNDGSGTIRASLFEKTGIEIGDLVDLIGVVKTYRNFKYLSIYSVNRLEDLNWELLRELEILKEKLRFSKEGKELSDKERVLRAIQKLDTGQGADYERLLERCDLEKDKIKSTVIELLKDGDIYEPRSGKLKSL